VLGMGALLTSIVRAPLTGIVLMVRADRRIQLHAAAPRKLFRGLRRGRGHE